MTQEELNDTAKSYREGAEAMRNVKDTWDSMTERDKDRAIRDLWDKGIKIDREKNFYDTFIKEHIDDLDEEFLEELERRIEIWEDEADFYENDTPDDWISGDELSFIPKRKSF